MLWKKKSVAEGRRVPCSGYSAKKDIASRTVLCFVLLNRIIYVASLLFFPVRYLHAATAGHTGVPSRLAKLASVILRKRAFGKLQRELFLIVAIIIAFFSELLVHAINVQQI